MIELITILLNNNTMSKIKSFSGLGEIYNSIQEKATVIPEATKPSDILNTDTSKYLFESSQDIDAKTKVEIADKKNTGPHGADNFEPVKKDKKEKKGEEDKEHEEAADKKGAEKTKEEADERTKEKVDETVETASNSNKYKKQQFTMPKSKFDQLYEDAVNNVPFVSEEEDITPVAPAADAGGELGAGDEPAAEEAAMSHQEAIEALEKVLAFLKKDVEHDVETGTLGDEEGGAPGGDMGETPVMEEVEAEDRGHPYEGSGVKTEMGSDKNKIQKVGKGVVTQSGGTADASVAGVKSEPTPKKEKDSAHLRDGHKLHTAGSGKLTKSGADAFGN